MMTVYMSDQWPPMWALDRSIPTAHAVLIVAMQMLDSRNVCSYSTYCTAISLGLPDPCSADSKSSEAFALHGSGRPRLYCFSNSVSYLVAKVLFPRLLQRQRNDRG